MAIKNLVFEDGSTYKGDWVNGKPHGKGKLIYADGRIEEGSWKNDKFIR